MRRWLIHLGKWLQFQRIEAWAKEAGMRPRISHAVVANRPGNRHRRRQASPRKEIRHDPRWVGKILAAAAIAWENFLCVGLARQRDVTSLPVVVERMGQRADDRHLVGMLGHERQMLAQVNPWRARRHRLEQTANTIRGIRLQVEHVLVRWAAPKVNKYARSRFSLRTLTVRRCLRSCPQQLRQCQRPEPQLS